MNILIKGAGIALRGLGKALQKTGQKIQKSTPRKTPKEHYHAMTPAQKRARRTRARLKDRKKLTPKYNKDGSLRAPRTSKQMKAEKEAGTLEKIEFAAKQGKKGSFQRKGRKPLND